MPYAEDIKQCNSIDDIIDYCHNALPEEYKGRPWTHPELNHGINLLASDVALNCYMSAYGDMHVTKCRAAMMNFPFNDIQGSIEIRSYRSKDAASPSQSPAVTALPKGEPRICLPLHSMKNGAYRHRYAP